MSGAPKTAGPAAPAKAPQFKPDQMEYYHQDELLKVDYDRMPEKDWMSEPAVIRHGNFIYPAKPQKHEYIGFPNAREWSRRCGTTCPSRSTMNCPPA